jgi:hypothetical protein
MTRIITITSGLTQIGKTHLAVNLALEMVRRGRRAGLYHELHSATPVDALLALQQAAPPRRRATDNVRTDKVVRRGYLGIDILGCELPLQQLAQLPAGQLERCIESMDAEDGYDDFLIDTSGMEPHALLACCTAAALVILVVTADPHSQAEAFTALFPDSEAAGCMVVLVDALDELAAAASGTLAEFWSDFLERVRTPVQLAGDIQLETLAAADELFEQLAAVEVPGQGDGLGLLRFDGNLHGLCTALEQAPSSLQVLAADVSGFAASLEAAATAPDGGFTDRAENAALPGMAAVLLRAATVDASDAAQVQLQVDECRVSGADTAWLRAGRYLRFVFRVSATDELPEPLLALLARVPVTGQDTGVPEEQVWEMLSHAHTGCLHVIAAPGAGVRIQVWLPADAVVARAGAAGAGKTAGSGAASERLH